MALVDFNLIDFSSFISGHASLTSFAWKSEISNSLLFSPAAHYYVCGGG